MLIGGDGNFAIENQTNLPIMKNAFFRTAFLLLTFGFISAAFTAAAHEDKDKERNNHPITIRKDQPSPLPTCPRMPARVAIGCMYEAASESLSFQFFDEIGGVAITVMNTTTGEIICDFCSSTPGSCRIALSGDEGSYRIELEDDRGRIYTGEFEL